MALSEHDCVGVSVLSDETGEADSSGLAALICGRGVGQARMQQRMT